MERFTIDSFREEVQQIAPDKLGDVYRNVDENDTDSVSHCGERVKALVALAVLLNARSRKCTRIQLFIGMMLVARATKLIARNV